MTEPTGPQNSAVAATMHEWFVQASASGQPGDRSPDASGVGRTAWTNRCPCRAMRWWMRRSRSRSRRWSRSSPLSLWSLAGSRRRRPSAETVSAPRPAPCARPSPRGQRVGGGDEKSRPPRGVGPCWWPVRSPGPCPRRHPPAGRLPRRRRSRRLRGLTPHVGGRTSPPAPCATAQDGLVGESQESADL